MTRRIALPISSGLTYPTHARRQRDLVDAYQRTLVALLREAAEKDAMRRKWERLFVRGMGGFARRDEAAR